jgi:hypothetical protein
MYDLKINPSDLSVWSIWSWLTAKYTICHSDCRYGDGQNRHDSIVSGILAKQEYRCPQHKLLGLSLYTEVSQLIYILATMSMVENSFQELEN